MRILSITAQKPNSTGSGVYLSELVKGFDGLGVEQAVVAGVTKGDEVTLPEGVSFYPVYHCTGQLPFATLGMSDEMPYESTKYKDMTEDMIAMFQEAFISRIREVVLTFQPDMILCHHLYLLTAMVREAFPKQYIIGICHGTGLRQIKKIPLKKEYIMKHIAQLNQVLALHEEQKLDIMRTLDVAEEKLTIIGSGYNAQIFYNQNQRKNSEKISLIFAGKLAEKKGVVSLLNSLSYLPYPINQLEVKLAGGYGSQEEYETICMLAEKSKYSVHILGKLNQQCLAQEFNLCDVFVLPSFYEGLPLVILEALACGLKVVCTDLPGIRAWLEVNLPGNEVTYVKPPRFINADEPKKEELPQFEKDLAKAIEGSISNLGQSQPDLSGLSWEMVCKRIL